MAGELERCLLIILLYLILITILILIKPVYNEHNRVAYPIQYTVNVAQRNRYPETGSNGAPSLSNMTEFYVNVTETFSDGARVYTNGNRRTLPHGNVLIVIDVMVT